MLTIMIPMKQFRCCLCLIFVEPICANHSVMIAFALNLTVVHFHLAIFFFGLKKKEVFFNENGTNLEVMSKMDLQVVSVQPLPNLFLAMKMDRLIQLHDLLVCMGESF